MAQDLWEPVRQPGSLSQRIAQRIEQLIDAEQLHVGDRLPAERDLASLLGVSRPSLREALRILGAQGRLSIRHGQGVFIEDPSEQRLRQQLGGQSTDVDELFAMREVLEVPAAGWAAEKATDEQLDGIRVAYEKLNRAAEGDPPDWDELQRLDAMFHEAVVLAAGNRFMEQTVGVLNEIMVTGMKTTLRLPGRLDKSSEDHARLLEALIARDPDAARAAVSDHVLGAWGAARENLATDETAAAGKDGKSKTSRGR